MTSPERAWARLMKASSLAMSHVEGALKQAGLPPLVWYDALLELERAGKDGLRPFELQRHMLLEQYNLSRLIARLESEGLVRREECAEDGRGHVVAITPAGKACRKRMWTIYGPAIQQIIAEPLDGATIDNLDEALGRLIAHLTASEATPTRVPR